MSWQGPIRLQLVAEIGSRAGFLPLLGRLAAVAAADPVTNFLERQREFPESENSRGEQRRARIEVGASPEHAPRLYLLRSPSAYAARLASARVPTRLWRSRRDRVVIAQSTTQAGELFRAVKRIDPQVPISDESPTSATAGSSGPTTGCRP